MKFILEKIGSNEAFTIKLLSPEKSLELKHLIESNPSGIFTLRLHKTDQDMMEMSNLCDKCRFPINQ
jgi:hypothetical protein